MYTKQSGKVLFPVIIVVLIAISGYFYLPISHGKAAQGTPSATEVMAHTAQFDSKTISIEAIGTARANQAINIVSAQSDYIESIAFNDGDAVNAGQVLAVLKSQQEQLNVNELSVNLKEEKRQLTRLSELARSQSAAKSQLEAQSAVVEALEVKLANAKSKLDEMTIKAPFAGVLGQRLVDVGSFVTNSTAIVTLDDISVIKVDFQVPEKYLAQVSNGMRVRAAAEAYPSQHFIGAVSHVDPRINPNTRSIKVTASFTNKNNLLRPGMLMQLALELNTINALMVPEKSIIPRQDKHFVYVIDNDNKAQQIQVSIGERIHGWVAINAGINEGQQVITEGIIKLRPGAAVVTKG
jgi:membrane fusion protein (multidrug efflux system)